MSATASFSVRDLRQKSGEVLRTAEEGRLAIITKHGRPVILAVPLDERLLRVGVHRSLALRLFKDQCLTLAQAAKVADLGVGEFIDLLAGAGMPVVDYAPEELDDELKSALCCD